MADTDKTATPPWGADFDAERAWTLVQNLRAEIGDLKEKVTEVTTERDTVTTERDALQADATAATEKLTAAEERAAEAARGLAVERVLAEFPTLRDVAEFLTGDDEDAIREKATRLAKVSGSATPGDGDKPVGDKSAEPIDRTPKPDLTPGHGGEPPVVVDTDAVVNAARARR